MTHPFATGLYANAQRRARLERFHAEVDGLLCEIEKLFSEPVKLTLIVRNPAHPDGRRDVFLTSDTDHEAAISAIRRAIETGEQIGPTIEELKAREATWSVSYQVVDLRNGKPMAAPPFSTLDSAKAFAEHRFSGSDHAWSTDNLENDGAVCALAVRDEEGGPTIWVAEIVEVES